MMTGRIMPQSIEMESAVLGAILVDRDGLSSVIHILKPESFYKNVNGIVYETMVRLFEKNMPIDLLTMHEELKKSQQIEEIGGVKYLMQLSDRIASSANIEHHARIVAQKYMQRELIKVCSSAMKDAYDDVKDVFDMLEDAERSLFGVTDRNLNTGYNKVDALVHKSLKRIEMLASQTGTLTGVTTGFRDLDKITSGWQKSDLVIVAARPGMGKTAFTLSLAHNAAQQNKAVAIFSLEMSNDQLIQRLLSMDASINSHKLRNGKLSKDDWTRLQTSVDRISDMPIIIDDTPAINIFELRAKCRRIKQQHDVELIIIDYLQLMNGAPNKQRQNREQEISAISRSLKALAKELDVPVIALSQLSRAVETRGGVKRPILSDLRESGAIEQDADIVTFIYRPAYYDMDEVFDQPQDLAEIIIAKHRNGSLDTVKLRFVPEYVRFENQESDNLFTTHDGFRDPATMNLIPLGDAMEKKTPF